MKFEQTKREYWMEEIPHIIEYLEKVDRSLNNGIELVVRDTDHHYSSLCLCYRNIDSFPHDLDKQICDYSTSHCCICGGTEQLQRADILGYDFKWVYGYPPFAPYVCINCYEHRGRKTMSYDNFIKMQLQRQSTEQGYKAWHIKLRLYTKNGNIIYRFADEVFIKDGCYTIKDKRDPNINEFVDIIGIDTGKRDVNDERIYSGDILLMEYSYGENHCGRDFVYIQSLPNEPSWHLVPRDCNGHIPFEKALKVKIVGHLYPNMSFDSWCDENEHLNKQLII